MALHGASFQTLCTPYPSDLDDAPTKMFAIVDAHLWQAC